MKLSSMRSAVVIASVVVGSVIPSQAYAQTQIDVLKNIQHVNDGNFTATSQYTFTAPMILNSIGFYTNGGVPTSLSYSVKGTTYILNTHFTLAQLSNVDNGMQYLTISPQSMTNGDVVRVNTLGGGSGNKTPFALFGVNPGTNVQHNGMGLDGGNLDFKTYTNSNLRVSNVAPEPGSFALTLTGGAALIGICIRRRRNAS